VLKQKKVLAMERMDQKELEKMLSYRIGKEREMGLVREESRR